MSGNGVLIELADNLFTHMRMIRRKTIGEQRPRHPLDPRSHERSSRRWRRATPQRAEELVRSHALGLAEHVEKYADYLD